MSNKRQVRHQAKKAHRAMRLHKREGRSRRVTAVRRRTFWNKLPYYVKNLMRSREDFDTDIGSFWG